MRFIKDFTAREGVSVGHLGLKERRICVRDGVENGQGDDAWGKSYSNVRLKVKIERNFKHNKLFFRCLVACAEQL